MEPKKYWWIHYDRVGIQMYREKETVIDIHPFLWLSETKKQMKWEVWLVNWKLIDVTEYNLWKELNDK